MKKPQQQQNYYTQKSDVLDFPSCATDECETRRDRLKVVVSNYPITAHCSLSVAQTETSLFLRTIEIRCEDARRKVKLVLTKDRNLLCGIG